MEINVNPRYSVGITFTDQSGRNFSIETIRVEYGQPWKCWHVSYVCKADVGMKLFEEREITELL